MPKSKILLSLVLFAFSFGYTAAQYPENDLTPEEFNARLYPCETHTGSSSLSDQLDMNPLHFFNFTPERFKAYYKGPAFISCEANVSTSGGFRYLTLILWVDSPSAEDIYGNIPVDALLRIQGINGQTISLKNMRLADPEQIEKQAATRYIARYLVGKSDFKWLKSTPVDLIRIFWRKGYEEIPIYKIGLIQSQIKCLDELK